MITQNEELKVKNKKLEEENTELLADQKELERKRNQINDMVVSS